MKINQAVDPYNRETKRYIVAYLDILGATNRIRENKIAQDDSLNLLYNLYKHTMSLASENGIKKFADIKFKIFSDNIIIAKEISDNINNDVLSLLGCVSNFLCSSVGDSVGWLVRGGVTIGDFYIDDMVVWGSALVRAYELEDKIAVYPRVVLDDNVVEIITKIDADYVRRDTDGQCFLNYMTIWSYAGEFVQAAFEQMKTEAIKKDGTYPDKVRQKLWWHMNYINQALDEKDQKQDRKFRLSIE